MPNTIEKKRQYHVVNTKKSAEYIIDSVLQKDHHILLKPPRLNGSALDRSLPDSPDEKMIGLYSSGSTRNPACIWNSYANLKRNARMTYNMFDISEHQSILIIASPWHVAGLSWALMAEHGGNLYHVVPPRRKQASLWPRLINDTKPDVLLTVPTVLRLMGQESSWFVPNIVCGGEPLKPADYHMLSRHSDTLYQAYGQTEAGGLISVHRRNLKQPPGFHEFQCCGYTPAECNIRCDGSCEAPAPILLKSPTSIYSNWYDTGDKGFMDSLNRLYLSGRNDE